MIRTPELDPDAAARVASFGPIPPMRQRGLDAIRRAVESTPHPDDLPVMAAIEDHTVNVGSRQVPVRIYRPHTMSDSPALVYFHGGGLVMGSVQAFEPLAKTLAATSGATVLSVEYRLAPEHPAPAQFDDAYTATCWAADNAARLGLDCTRLGVVGDSAGGSLAAAVALAARDHAGPELFVQVLLYPGLDRDMGAPSIALLADAPMLSRDDIDYLHHLADAGAAAAGDAYRIPAHAADLTELPPAIVVTGECDPIRDWGERYAGRLRDAGVQTTITRYPGMYHGFLMRSDSTARGRLAIAETGALLSAKFAHPLKF